MTTTDEQLQIDRSKLEISKTDVAIEIKNMHKWYGEFHVLRDINLKVMRGERIVVAGPSGSGKSTMIRCVNRLEEHQKGQIIVDGIELTNDLKKIDEVRREVGMVFQHFNLFPHLTILENCTLAPIWVRKKVLDTMVSLAAEGMTMICVTHEMGFARQVANRVIFMDQGQIVEQNSPDEFFDNPQHERTKLFLSQILH
ncbi:amino acid ABC transporter ATP-binding protein [Brucella sp. 09RB8918]|uniref:amino acid ABC transporter ATP-binding protein n=1 Tax=Brucella sp. 09RB8918 TaxID=1844048 RepID=UPI0012AD7D48|nr:amino acid ABC transporter ATP-binding protein [Brucella sp. 09RB8918]MRN59475.1 ATP-binding cassette domain-containing protein [Brucella sp. 09RB8918]